MTKVAWLQEALLVSKKQHLDFILKAALWINLLQIKTKKYNFNKEEYLTVRLLFLRSYPTTLIISMQVKHQYSMSKIWVVIFLCSTTVFYSVFLKRKQMPIETCYILSKTKLQVTILVYI